MIAVADYTCALGSVRPASDGRVRARFLLSVEHDGQTHTHGAVGEKGGTEYLFPVPGFPAFATPSKPTDAELAANIEAVALFWLLQIGKRVVVESVEVPPPDSPGFSVTPITVPDPLVATVATDTDQPADPLTVHVSLDDLDADEEETKP